VAVSPFLQEASNIATAIAACIAAASLYVAARQIVVTRAEARRSSAHQIYREYLALAMSNPRFSSASYPISLPLFETFRSDSLQYESYEFYVSHLLFAAEGILEISADKQWERVLRDQFRYHALYLRVLHSENRLKPHYDRCLVRLCLCAVRDYKAETRRHTVAQPP
jgi:hypothetical protein